MFGGGGGGGGGNAGHPRLSLKRSCQCIPMPYKQVKIFLSKSLSLYRTTLHQIWTAVGRSVASNQVSARDSHLCCIVKASSTIRSPLELVHSKGYVHRHIAQEQPCQLSPPGQAKAYATFPGDDQDNAGLDVPMRKNRMHEQRELAPMPGVLGACACSDIIGAPMSFIFILGCSDVASSSRSTVNMDL